MTQETVTTVSAHRPCGHDGSPKQHCFMCCHHCWRDLADLDDVQEDLAYIPPPRWVYDNPNVAMAVVAGWGHGRHNSAGPDGDYWLWPLSVNEHGIHGTPYTDPTVFLPLVCLQCPFLDHDSDEWRGTSFDFCTKNVIFPVRKGTCKVYEREMARLEAFDRELLGQEAAGGDPAQ